MEDEEIREYEKTLLEQKYLGVLGKCLLLQAGLVMPAFLLGRAYEIHEAASWLSLLWLLIIIISSSGILYTVISYYKYKPK